jgi:biopolymer transport protein TolR
MGMSVGVRGTFTEMNVVPLIDILLVLLVIFMIIPNSQGFKEPIPGIPDSDAVVAPRPEVVVVQVLTDGSLRINQERVEWASLRDRLEQVFKTRAERTAFIRGDAPVEFAAVVQVLDVMHGVGITAVGLMTPDMENRESGH